MSTVKKPKRKRRQIFKRINERLGITEKRKPNLINRLTKIPQKEKRNNTGHFLNFGADENHQADLLYLPHEKRGNRTFKYALVVVDLGTRLMDAEPLSSKSPAAVLTALQKIYRRPYLSLPKVQMSVDPGSEFKGVFREYLEGKGVQMKVGAVNNHSSQAIVEGANKTIGKAIALRSGAQELKLDSTSTEWISDLSRIVKAYNEEVEETEPSDKEKLEEMLDKPPQCSGRSCTLLDKGTKVRVMLNRPTSIVKGQKLTGKFRAGDIRWSRDIHTIDKVIVKPGSAPLYRVSGIGDQLFTRGKLMVENKAEEKLPPDTALRSRPAPKKGEPKRWEIVAIRDKKKIGKKWFYLVKWKGYRITTWNEASITKQDAPLLVREFEEKWKMKGKKLTKATKNKSRRTSATSTLTSTSSLPSSTSSETVVGRSSLRQRRL